MKIFLSTKSHFFIVTLCLIYVTISNEFKSKKSEIKNQPKNYNLVKKIKNPFKYNSSLLNVCSFNIKFLGLYSSKSNENLAQALSSCDLIAIQELIAPAGDHCYNKYRKKICTNVKAFHEFLLNQNYKHHISPHGTGKSIHLNSFQTNHEWPIFYYNPIKITLNEIESNYISNIHVNHQTFDRVPYQIKIYAKTTCQSINLISLHLHAGTGRHSRMKRIRELVEIKRWLTKRRGNNFIILGDFNINDPNIIHNLFENKLRSSNKECLATNNFYLFKPKCYDHIAYNSHLSQKLKSEPDFSIIDIYKIFGKHLENDFSHQYSDHFPITTRFQLKNQCPK